MKIKCFLLAVITCIVTIMPMPTMAAEQLLTIEAKGNNTLKASGYTGYDEMVTLRSLYFGKNLPDMPADIEDYEVSAEEINSQSVKVHHIEVQNTVNKRYSFNLDLKGEGYYMITVSSENGQRKSEIYLYEQGQAAENKYTDKARCLEISGSEFVLLDIADGNVTLMPLGDMGVATGSELLEYMGGINAMLPEEMRDYLVSAQLPGSEFFAANNIGYADKTGVFGNSLFKIMSNSTDNRDTLCYKEGRASSEDKKLSLENILFDSGTVIQQKLINEETVIEFTAPVDGSYTVNMGLSGTGEAKLELTALRGNSIFDYNSLCTAEYTGSQLSKNIPVELKGGEKVYLHIYPTSGNISLSYSLVSNGISYSLSDISEGANAVWLLESEENGRYAYSMDSGLSERAYLEGAETALYVRPVLTFSEDLLKNVKINVIASGREALTIVSDAFDRSDFSIYSDFELDVIYNKNGRLIYEILSVTDKDGQSVNTPTEGVLTANARVINTTDDTAGVMLALAVYAQNGELLQVGITENNLAGGRAAEYAASVNITEVSEGMTLKTFLWETMTPIDGKIVARPVDASAADGNGWRVLERQSGEILYENYTEHTLTGNSSVYVDILFNSNTVKWIMWDYNDIDNTITLYPRKGREHILEYEIPEDGSWYIDLVWRNVGYASEQGGDGGSLVLMYLPKGENEVRTFAKKSVYISKSPYPQNSYSNIIKAKKGDKILLAADSAIDGYGDVWEVNYTISEANHEGMVIDESYNGILPKADGENTASGADTDKKVWIGISGTFADSDEMKAKVTYIKKYLPDFGVIMGAQNANLIENGKYFEEKNIPVLVQSYGVGYEGYISENGAWEQDWENTPLDTDMGDGYAGSGTAHAYAQPHFATREIFGRMTKAAAQNGLSGFGYPDFVWTIGLRGRTGYNPETIKAFRNDLMGLDTGLSLNDGVWYFEDYYKYYTGSDTKILPSDLGFSSWEEYSPLSKTDSAAMEDAGKDTTAHWAIFDLLCHYEWLKTAQYIGKTAADNNIISQILINAEYFANGVDYKLLNKLDSVTMTEDEYFRNTDYLDGAYYRQKYLSNDNKNTGAVMEAGVGGNAGAYYTDEIAYLSAFELGALSYIKHLEADFMYQNIGYHNERDGQIMSFCMGFNDAKTLGLDKRAADFVVVSSRNHLRPWSDSQEWYPWDLRLGYDKNREFNLAKMGYNFESISQEGLRELGNEPVLVFSPHIVTRSAWDEFIKRVQQGGATGIISAGRFDRAVTEKLQTVSFSEVASDYCYTSQAVNVQGTVNEKAVALNGKAYTPKASDTVALSIGDCPVLAKRTAGTGEMYILLFDDYENYELAEAVYDYIFAEQGIKPMYKSIQNIGSYESGYAPTPAEAAAVAADRGASVRVYENGGLTAVGIQNSLARVNVTSTVTSTGSCAPYKISGTTEARVLMSPNTIYSYIAVPSGKEGTVTADSAGYVRLSFDNTSHEIFFLAPEGSRDFADIKNMQSLWKEALMFE